MEAGGLIEPGSLLLERRHEYRCWLVGPSPNDKEDLLDHIIDIGFGYVSLDKVAEESTVSLDETFDGVDEHHPPANGQVLPTHLRNGRQAVIRDRNLCDNDHKRQGIIQTSRLPCEYHV